MGAKAGMAGVAERPQVMYVAASLLTNSGVVVNVALWPWSFLSSAK
jgi:hypothetical protein